MADVLSRPIRVRDLVLIDGKLPACVLAVRGDQLRVLTADGQDLTLPRVSVELRFPELEDTHAL